METSLKPEVAGDFQSRCRRVDTDQNTVSESVLWLWFWHLYLLQLNAYVCACKRVLTVSVAQVSSRRHSGLDRRTDSRAAAGASTSHWSVKMFCHHVTNAARCGDVDSLC